MLPVSLPIIGGGEDFPILQSLQLIMLLLVEGLSFPGRPQLFLGLLLKFLHFWGYKLLHLCDLLYLNQAVFVGAHCFVTSPYDMPAPELCNSFMVSLPPFKRCTTSDKATALGDFSPVTRLYQSQATDPR